MLIFLTFQTLGLPLKGVSNAHPLSLSVDSVGPSPICMCVFTLLLCCGAKCECIALIKRGARTWSASLPQMNFLCNISFPTICIQYIHTHVKRRPTALLLPFVAHTHVVLLPLLGTCVFAVTRTQRTDCHCDTSHIPLSHLTPPHDFHTKANPPLYHTVKDTQAAPSLFSARGPRHNVRKELLFQFLKVRHHSPTQAEQHGHFSLQHL